VTSNRCGPTDNVPVPFSVLPSAVRSPVSATCPSFDSSAASTVTRAPFTVTRFSGASLVAPSPFVDPV